VVKSNAYGHGLVDFAKEVEKLGVDWLGVDSIVEGESLKKAGVKTPILVLGYTLPSKIKSAVDNNISLSISDFPTLKSLKKVNGQLKIHLKIDTGMHRQGFFVTEIPEVIKVLKSCPSVTLEGVFTHFSSAKNPAFPAATLKQIEEFKKAVAMLEAAGFSNFIKHAAATAGAIIFPQSHFDMVRVGIGMYGIWPAKETYEAYKNKINLEPVLSWKTIVGQLKDLPSGSKVSYDLTEELTRKSKVAILPVGYWHGFPRSLSSIGRVLIRSKEAKVLGRVTMDMIIVDVTEVKDIKIGDEVVLIGKGGRAKISADGLAYLTDGSSYEIITRLNPLMRRFVV
jgi:alanine racemase